MKFVDGLMIHSGNPAEEYVDTAVRHVLLRQGVLGIKVKIMLPHDPSGKNGPKNTSSGSRFYCGTQGRRNSDNSLFRTERCQTSRTGDCRSRGRTSCGGSACGLILRGLSLFMMGIVDSGHAFCSCSCFASFLFRSF